MTINRTMLALATATCLALFMSACQEKPAGEDTTTARIADHPDIAVVSGPADWIAEYGSPPEVAIKAIGCDKSETVVRNIDDPESPYQGRYLELDYWCWGNTNPDEALMIPYLSGAGPEGFQAINVAVDSDGFIVPQIEIHRMNIIKSHLEPPAQWQRDEYPHLDFSKVMIHADSETCMRSFRTGGVVPPEVSAAFESAVCGILAGYIPAVPAWLADAPPVLVLLMPGGEVAAYGELGSDSGGLTSLAEASTTASQPWLRYNSDGELLARNEPGHDWVELFFPDYLAITKNYEGRGCRVIAKSGLVAVFTAEGQGLEALFDYRGNSLEPTAEVAEAFPLPYEEIPGRLVKCLFDAQQALERNLPGTEPRR